MLCRFAHAMEVNSVFEDAFAVKPFSDYEYPLYPCRFFPEGLTIWMTRDMLSLNVERHAHVGANCHHPCRVESRDNPTSGYSDLSTRQTR